MVTKFYLPHQHSLNNVSSRPTPTELTVSISSDFQTSIFEQKYINDRNAPLYSPFVKIVVLLIFFSLISREFVKFISKVYDKMF